MDKMSVYFQNPTVVLSRFRVEEGLCDYDAIEHNSPNLNSISIITE